MVTMGLNSGGHMPHWAFSEQIQSYLTVLGIQLLPLRELNKQQERNENLVSCSTFLNKSHDG
jgi:hypothetical protein